MGNAMSAISTTAIANYFIGKSLATGRQLTPMQLIKLVYIAHGWYLGHHGEPLIGEAVEAWKYGPVIPSLYHSFKKYRDGQITQQKALLGSNGLVIPSVQDEGVADFLDKVWNAYSEFSGIQLSTMCHQDGTPWHETWVKHRGSEKQGAIIPTDAIKEHYKNLIAERVGTNAKAA